MTALSGLTYNGTSVTVYDDLPIGTLPDNYVYINSIDDIHLGDNNSVFNHTGIVTLDIVTKQYKKVDRDTVDGIAEQVMNTILPSINSTLSDTNFSFYNIRMESSRYLNGVDGDYHLTRKILQFSQTLIQK
jgi:hypothetical protein